MPGESNVNKLLDKIRDAVILYDEQMCVNLCRTALETGIDARIIVDQSLKAGMERVGELFSKREYFVPELLLCSETLNAGLKLLRPHLKIEDIKARGRLILGVVQGDIHDIGKNIVKAMFVAAGWEVIDLGKDVKLERFVSEHRKKRADVIALSALMTTTMAAMPKVIEVVKSHDPDVRVLVGGAPLTLDVAKRYGADGYAPDAVLAVREAERMLIN